MEEKIKEYIKHIDEELDNCLKMLKENLKKARLKEVTEEEGLIEYMNIASHRCTLAIVKRDLINILNE